tara:strand:- start:1090 stop:1236 length:147 start_codon:yes stop_codon:yes gene_type:complete
MTKDLIKLAGTAPKASIIAAITARIIAKAIKSRRLSGTIEFMELFAKN